MTGGPATGTIMAAEIAEIPDMLARQIEGLDRFLALGRQLRGDGLRGIVTCARGTSDHAATHFKYLMEARAGLPVASVGPSVASVHGAALRLDGFACLTFSQSGGSPDLVALQAAARAGGARTVAIVNAPDSPVAAGADVVLPLDAGPERAVAATKSFVAMLFAGLAVMLGYRGATGVRDLLAPLPDLARRALRTDWSEAGCATAGARSVYCLGRGAGLAVAQEAALKFKETCHIHAEACSAAEVLHGPIALADARLAALVFGSEGPEAVSLALAAERLAARGARVFRVGPAADLAVPAAGAELLAPLVQAIAFYRFVERLSVSLGESPDAPRGLRKVTRTV